MKNINEMAIEIIFLLVHKQMRKKIFFFFKLQK
jgi:hypothetical protein